MENYLDFYANFCRIRLSTNFNRKGEGHVWYQQAAAYTTCQFYVLRADRRNSTTDTRGDGMDEGCVRWRGIFYTNHNGINNVRRKPRKGEHVCRCPAYRFPHRFGGGKCTGFHVVAQQWYTFFGLGACENCISNSDGSCQIVEGRESEKECPVFQELVDFEEIRLLGQYWKRTW